MTHSEVFVEQVAPVVLDIEEETKDEDHVHEADEDNHHHARVDRHPHHLPLLPHHGGVEVEVCSLGGPPPK